MSRPDPVGGQTVYSLNVGNAARGRAQVLTPMTVIRVGRKFFYAVPRDYPSERAYHLGTWREVTNYSPDSELYASEQEWADEKEARKIQSKLTAALRCGAPIFPLAALRAAHAALFPPTNPET